MAKGKQTKNKVAKRPSLESSTDIMRYLAEKYFDNRCWVTHEKFKPRGFVIHHLHYIQNDVERKNYPNGEKGRLQYLKDLVPMVEKDPKRFVLIKNGIHTRLDHVRRGLTRMKRENFIRLAKLVMMTKKKNTKLPTMDNVHTVDTVDTIDKKVNFKPRKNFKME